MIILISIIIITIPLAPCRQVFDALGEVLPHAQGEDRERALAAHKALAKLISFMALIAETD